MRIAAGVVVGLDGAHEVGAERAAVGVPGRRRSAACFLTAGAAAATLRNAAAAPPMNFSAYVRMPSIALATYEVYYL